jgi:hypothetical protein
MPAKTPAQRALFGIALAIKRGETPESYSPAATKIAENLPESKIREFAKKPKGKKSATKSGSKYTLEDIKAVRSKKK